jgi:integrase
MAFRRPGSKTYYTEVRVGDIRLPRLSTGMRDKRSAEEVENALQAAWRWGHHDLIHRVASREVSLTEVWEAWCKPEREQALRLLSDGMGDPTLESDVEYMRTVITDERVLAGLDMILHYAPTGARRSWLMDPPTITQMYRRAVQDGRTEATVLRTLHRAISDLITERVGRGTMLALMADVRKPSAPSTRTEILTQQEIRTLVYGAPDVLRPALALSILTGVDRGPLLKLRVRDLDLERGHLWIPDAKTDARPRFLPLEGGMVAWAAAMAVARTPGEPLVGADLTVYAVRGLWERLRATTGMPNLRWKDLRGVFATWAYRCAWDPLRIQTWLGHTNPVMTQRYIKRVELLPQEPRQIAAAMGLEHVQ